MNNESHNTKTEISDDVRQLKLVDWLIDDSTLPGACNGTSKRAVSEPNSSSPQQSITPPPMDITVSDWIRIVTLPMDITVSDWIRIVGAFNYVLVCLVLMSCCVEIYIT